MPSDHTQEMILAGGWYCLVTETADELYHRWLARKVSESGGTANLDKTEGIPLEVSIHDRDEEIIAGLVGYTQGALFIIALAWLHARHPDDSLAMQLASIAEAEARRRGCRQAYVQTSAIEFYSRLGYHIAPAPNNIISLRPHQNIITLYKELA